MAKAQRILVVEDDRGFRTYLLELLGLWGYDVSVADDGQAALEHCRAQNPALILTDIVMPNSDGFELVTGLKREYPALKIIAISGADAGQTYLKVAGALGAHAVLHKPFPPESLKEKIEEMLDGD
ncbi:MAG: response regulator [Gammaproteobacteria bacterium]|nr:response regulator [Gammaproteobacteria bacterium]